MLVTEISYCRDREMWAAPKAIPDNMWTELPSDACRRKLISVTFSGAINVPQKMLVSLHFLKKDCR